MAGVVMQALDGCPLAGTWIQATRSWYTLPFDVLRQQYSRAVQAGWIERSMLQSARFGQALNALERLTLGPLARCD